MAEDFNAVEEIKKVEESLNPEVTEFDPSKNPKAMSLIEMPDGNWKGYAQRNGKLVVIRDIGPQTVVERLLTSDGTSD